MTTETITVGKYTFNIKDNILQTPDGMIYSRSFKIGGNYSDCVNVSITYDRDNNPVSAKIPTLIYDPECSLTAPLDKGEGTIIMIKTLLRYIKHKIPEINEFVFEDKSNIECATEEEMRQKRHRKRGTHAMPIVLYYFSIAFNSVTWYEKHFNAYQQDISIHKKYRERVKQLLNDPEIKPSFDEFLRIAQPPMKYLDELKELYEKTHTYGDFFKSIPKDDRCRLTRHWIATFMEHYLKGVFKNTDWTIDVREMDKSNGGTRKKGKKYNTKYYCPQGRIRLTFEKMDMGVECV
jgi:hypothetical protein